MWIGETPGLHWFCVPADLRDSPSEFAAHDPNFTGSQCLPGYHEQLDWDTQSLSSKLELFHFRAHVDTVSSATFADTPAGDRVVKRCTAAARQTERDNHQCPPQWRSIGFPPLSNGTPRASTTRGAAAAKLRIKCVQTTSLVTLRVVHGGKCDPTPHSPTQSKPSVASVPFLII